MLNSPTGGTAAGNAFYMDVQRRVEASRESRKAVIEMAHVCERHNEPDYAEIVAEMNVRLSELFHAGDLTAITEQFGFPVATLQALYRKMGRAVQ